MALEIEKKYHLTAEQSGQIERRLGNLGAEYVGEAAEVNIIYQGGILTAAGAVLRIRKTGGLTTLAYKVRVSDKESVKHQLEYETGVENANEMENIIDSLGFKRSLIYEKRRRTWKLGLVEIVMDELPFGLYMEIEGTDPEIAATELSLGAANLPAESKTYPQLTLEYGVLRDDVIESRFSN